MKVKISKIDVMSVNIPFKRPFRHSSKSRSFSESIFVKITASSGDYGFGESLPRVYVTGDDQKSVMTELKTFLPEMILGRIFYSFDEIVAFCGSGSEIKGPAKCAFELAMLDCAGKIFSRPLFSILGGIKNPRLRYSAAIGTGGVFDTALSSFKFRLFGMRDIKIKVGDSNDLARVKTARFCLGGTTNIRLDSNCVWSVQEAVKKLNLMRPFGFSAIEQPSVKSDIESLARIQREIPEYVMADESLCSLDDARNLVSNKACKMFNIRLSKCGGILDSKRIADFARDNGILFQLGCQVGESGILSAAGRIFASCMEDLAYLEGSYAKFLLKEDVVREDVSFGYGGYAAPLEGNGLGVNIDEGILSKYTTDKAVIE